MKKKEIDKNFDYMTIFVKRDRLEEVEKRYQVFLWEIVQVREHERFGNIVVVDLKRPHQVEQKDELQFLQVQMEFLLNGRAKCENNKHSKSTCFGLAFGLLCSIAIALSILMIERASNMTQIVLGSVFLVVSLVLIAVLTVLTLKMAKCEDMVCKRKVEIINQKLDEVCKLDELKKQSKI